LVLTRATESSPTLSYHVVKSPRMLSLESEDSTWMNVQRLGTVHG
jgi:hypothetical protein